MKDLNDLCRLVELGLGPINQHAVGELVTGIRERDAEIARLRAALTSSIAINATVQREMQERRTEPPKETNP